ncbi:lipoprotein [Leptospira ryugenii]|uniref:Lipoprotein n=2 Tax=Leptospira ryugenii TaxID=1917863 RepID=A0A2P2DY64_9LEPT|nr:lipoprotein [Leptospira ryugenii]
MCKSAPKQEDKKPQETIVTKEEINENSPEVIEFTKAKEGFITGSLFQVAVSSVLSDSDARLNEARSIAEQKSLNLLKTYAPPILSEKGKKELREISKEGKIVDKNISIGGRYFFLYQIQRKDLKQLVTSGLE